MMQIKEAKADNMRQHLCQKSLVPVKVSWKISVYQTNWKNSGQLFSKIKKNGGLDKE